MELSAKKEIKSFRVFPEHRRGRLEGFILESPRRGEENDSIDSNTLTVQVQVRQPVINMALCAAGGELDKQRRMLEVSLV